MDNHTGGCKKLCPGALGFAVGILTALYMVVLAVLAWKFSYGQGLVAPLASLYWGFGGSLAGIGFGALWGFVDGFVCGFLIGFFYNFICKHCHCKHCVSSSEEKK